MWTAREIEIGRLTEIAYICRLTGAVRSDVAEATEAIRFGFLRLFLPQATRQERVRAAGLCPECREKLPTGENGLCALCRAVHHGQREARKAAGLCTRCRKRPNDGETLTCTACRLLNKDDVCARWRASYKRRNAAGLCNLCGGKRDRPDRKRCNSCRRKRAEYKRKRRRRG